MNQIPNHPVYAKNILEMLTVANDYCLTLKKVETIKKHNLIEYLARVIPLLYLKGSLVPVVEVQNPEINERFYTEEEWEILFNTLRKIFGKDDIFWYSDPELTEPPVKISLSEYLTDAFQDLHDFLTLYQKTSLDAKENAVKELRNLFITNWGFKLTKTLPHLHTLFFRDTEPPKGFDIPELF